MASEKLSGQVQFDVLMSHLERLVGEENRGDGGMVRRMGGNEQSVFTSGQEKSLFKKEGGKPDDSAVWYGRGSWDICTLSGSSSGAGRRDVGVKGWGGSGHACGGSFIKVGFGGFFGCYFKLIFCQQMVERLLKAASVGVNLGRGCWALKWAMTKIRIGQQSR